MKIFFIIPVFLFSVSAVAQNKLSKSIDDNGKLLKIKISGVQDGKEIHYKNSFDVKGMTKYQRDSIVAFVLDSLNIKEKKRVDK